MKKVLLTLVLIIAFMICCAACGDTSEIQRNEIDSAVVELFSKPIELYEADTLDDSSVLYTSLENSEISYLNSSISEGEWSKSDFIDCIPLMYDGRIIYSVGSEKVTIYFSLERETWYQNGNYLEMTDKDVEFAEKIKDRLEHIPKMVKLTIAESDPCCKTFEKNCFYAYDENNKLYRVNWSDFSGLYENSIVEVEYQNRITFEDITTPPPGGFVPKYEITPSSVTVKGSGQ